MVAKMFRATTLSFTLVVCIGFASCLEAVKSPILFIPGLTNSQLNAQDSSNGPCDTNGESRTVWVNNTLIGLMPECFAIQLELNVSANYSDVEGITVTTPDFYSIAALEFQGYATGFLEYFLNRGYTADVNIRFAPYDWRLAPEQLLLRGYYANLQQLIQTMYEQNGNTKVTIVVHSMGGPVSLYFLTRIVNQEWKDTYIHSYIPLAGAWSGGNAILPSLLSGPISNTDLDMAVGIQELRDLYRTFPSFYLLLPRAVAWNDTVLVITPTRNYTANDYQQLFADAGYPQGYTQFTEIDMQRPAPNVPTYCFYGLGVLTPVTVIYDDGFPNTQPTMIIPGDGDNAVNKPSSEICLQWANSGYPFNRTVFQGVDHGAILTDVSVLQAIGSIVGAPVNPINGALPLTTVNILYYVVLIISVVLGYYMY